MKGIFRSWDLAICLPTQMNRLWKMLAHYQGQTLNQSELGQSLGVSSVSIKKYISLLEQTFIIRQLQPYSANLKKAAR